MGEAEFAQAAGEGKGFGCVALRLSRRPTMSKSKGREKKPTLRGKQELDAVQRKEIDEAFALFDSENTGIIDSQDLWVALAALGFEPREEEFRKIMADIDKNGTMKVTKENFVQIMINKLFEWPSEEEVRKGFQQVFLSPGADTVTAGDLRRIAASIGNLEITDEELEEMINEADQSGTGDVNYEEFRAIITETFH